MSIDFIFKNVWESKVYQLSICGEWRFVNYMLIDVCTNDRLYVSWQCTFMLVFRTHAHAPVVTTYMFIVVDDDDDDDDVKKKMLQFCIGRAGCRWQNKFNAIRREWIIENRWCIAILLSVQGRPAQIPALPRCYATHSRAHTQTHTPSMWYDFVLNKL